MSIFNKLKRKKIETPKDTEKMQISTAEIKHVNHESHQHKSALLIKQAWITEKASNLSGFRKYIFIVDNKANKSEIKKAIKSIYGVKVINVNIINTLT